MSDIRARMRECYARRAHATQEYEAARDNAQSLRMAAYSLPKKSAERRAKLKEYRLARAVMGEKLAILHAAQNEVGALERGDDVSIKATASEVAQAFTDTSAALDAYAEARAAEAIAKRDLARCKPGSALHTERLAIWLRADAELTVARDKARAALFEKDMILERV